MNWAVLFLTTMVAGGTIYWLLVLSEGVYLGNRVVVALYDWSAAKYDAIKGVLVHEDGIHLARPLVEALQSAPSSRPGDGESTPLVLDVATGTGRLPQALLRQLNFNGRIVGLDPSRRMLAIAQSKTRAHHQRVAWIREDATALPFRGGTFHAVTCVEALEFLPSPEQALAEMLRVLRPGGQLLLSNRVGIDALFLPGRAYRPKVLEKKLEALGLTHVKTRRWQTHYDLIDAYKSVEEQRGNKNESIP
jgi:ubiquinone/menaquinone biosynthesis C-methylase UbiE